MDREVAGRRGWRQATATVYTPLWQPLRCHVVLVKPGTCALGDAGLPLISGSHSGRVKLPVKFSRHRRPVLVAQIDLSRLGYEDLPVKTRRLAPWTILVRYNAATGIGSCCFLNSETNEEGPRNWFTSFGYDFRRAHDLAEADAEETLVQYDIDAGEVLERAVQMALSAGRTAE